MRSIAVRVALVVSLTMAPTLAFAQQRRDPPVLGRHDTPMGLNRPLRNAAAKIQTAVHVVGWHLRALPRKLSSRRETGYSDRFLREVIYDHKGRITKIRREYRIYFNGSIERNVTTKDIFTKGKATMTVIDRHPENSREQTSFESDGGQTSSVTWFFPRIALLWRPPKESLTVHYNSNHERTEPPVHRLYDPRGRVIGEHRVDKVEDVGSGDRAP